MQLKLLSQGKRMKGLGVGDIGPTALSVGFAIIVVAIVAYILATLNSNISDANATSIINKGLSAMSTFGDWFTIIVIVVVSVIVLSLIALIRMRAGGRS